MRFKTEAERLAHPLAGKIPAHLWSDFFNSKITDDQLLLLKTPVDSLLGTSNTRLLRLRREVLDSRIAAWICILLANPEGSPARLYEVAKRMSLELEMAYALAGACGYLPMLKHLEEIAPEHITQMVEARDYEAYHQAAENGHLAILQHLEKIAPEHITQMVKAYRYQAYRRAAANGHLAILQHLKKIAPAHIEQMVKAYRYEAYGRAAQNGHLAILQHLEEIAPDYIPQMVEADRYQAYRRAAANGHLAILQYLKKIAPAHIEQMVKADRYQAYRWAAANGHLAILQHLEETAPDYIPQMVEAESYYAYRQAAANGHLSILEHLETIAPESILSMVEACNYEAYRLAVGVGGDHLEVVQHLLSFPLCFAYAEMHQREFGSQYVHPFVAEQLTRLRNERAALEAANPDAVFDIVDPEAAKLYFYMARNIIRRHDRTLNDDLRFLLDIPAVKALAHTAVTPNEENELLRLALTTNNTEAAALLLNIPAIRALAEQNNYYRAEARGALDLRALAQDNESSMRSLTTGEQQRLEAVIKKYQPLINAAGVHHIMEDLKETLLERYNDHPATAAINESLTELPAFWQDFQKLNLTNKEREQALIAYYQHKAHTAWRYLSKPNHWMNERAGYVYIDRDTSERWSTFEEYQPLIALFYLAATDQSTEAVDGHTYEGRVDHFIDELAHIGRAHNWDSRPGSQEKDDLTGDKPSCFSGVKRRLFQSVIGHPLITMLSQSIIDQELKSFVHAHFKTSINENNREGLKDAIEILANEIDIDEEAVAAPLKALDIKAEDINAFIAALREKYGAQFSADPSFEASIKNMLSLSGSLMSESMNSHLSKLYSFAGLRILLEPASVKETPASSKKISTTGLFATKPNQQDEKDTPDEQATPKR